MESGVFYLPFIPSFLCSVNSWNKKATSTVTAEDTIKAHTHQPTQRGASRVGVTRALVYEVVKRVRIGQVAGLRPWAPTRLVTHRQTKK